MKNIFFILIASMSLFNFNNLSGMYHSGMYHSGMYHSSFKVHETQKLNAKLKESELLDSDKDNCSQSTFNSDILWKIRKMAVKLKFKERGTFMKKLLILPILLSFGIDLFPMNSSKISKTSPNGYSFMEVDEFLKVKDVFSLFEKDKLTLKNLQNLVNKDKEIFGEPSELKKIAICFFDNFVKHFKDACKSDELLAKCYSSEQIRFITFVSRIDLIDVPVDAIMTVFSKIGKELKDVNEMKKNSKTDFVFFAFDFILDILKYAQYEDHKSKKEEF